MDSDCRTLAVIAGSASPRTCTSATFAAHAGMAAMARAAQQAMRKTGRGETGRMRGRITAEVEIPLTKMSDRLQEAGWTSPAGRLARKVFDGRDAAQAIRQA